MNGARQEKVEGNISTVSAQRDLSVLSNIQLFLVSIEGSIHRFKPLY